MAGGIGRVRQDCAADYARLRRRTWDVDLVPLPDNLALSPSDEALNRRQAAGCRVAAARHPQARLALLRRDERRLGAGSASALRLRRPRPRHDEPRQPLEIAQVEHLAW
jgi:hypothetical protein